MKTNAQSVSSESIFQKGRALAYKGQNFQAAEVFSKGLKDAIASGNRLLAGRFYLSLADQLVILNRIDSIERLYYLADSCLNGSEDKANSIRSKVGLLEMPRRANPASVIDKYVQLLGEARAMGDRALYYYILDRIIIVNFAMENYEEAIRLTHESLSFYKSTGDSMQVGIKYRNLANSFWSVGGDSSMYYYRKAEEIFKKLDSKLYLVYNYQSMGWFLSGSDVKQAVYYLNKADSIDRKFAIQSVQLPLILSFALDKLGKTSKAVEQARKSYELGWKTRQLFVAFQSAEALSKYYKKLNEIDSAMHYTEMYAFIKDSIRSEKQYKEAGRMQAKIEFEKQLFEKDLISKEESRRNNQFLLFLGIAFILVLTILVLVYRAYLFKTRSSAIIFRQNEEKELLLKEIHHRVKNNLAVIAGILDLQEREITNPEMLDKFRDARSRVNSMALVHKNLYEKDNYKNIGLQVYFENLFSAIYQGYKNPFRTVSFNLSTNAIELNTDTLIPLALIVNELLTNSFKYAFHASTEGEIKLSVSKTEQGYCLNYSDTGPGLPEDFDFTKAKSLGLKLIRRLSQQLKGNLTLVKQEKGFSIELFFQSLSKG